MRIAAILILAVLSAGCAQNPVPEPFPQQVADTWVAHFAAHDAAGVAALYTNDAQLLPPGMEAVSGRASIQEFVARTNPPDAPKIEFATIETLVFGDYAHRQGRYSVKGPDGAAIETGKFIELWKKVDGRWLIHREMWSPDAPPRRPATDTPSDESA